jgi:uncharacterized peroxidase-related enzyme
MAAEQTPLSRFPVPELDALPDDVRTRILAVQEKAGFIPNVFIVLAHRPDEFRAFFDYHDALMEKVGELSKAEREMIVVATSAANDCEYCVIAHGALLRIYGKNARLADQLAINYRGGEITPKQRAMLDFALKLAVTPGLIEETDFAPLRDHGFSDEAIWDIGAIAAFFGMSNRLASMTGMWANPEFYLLGRVPK